MNEWDLLQQRKSELLEKIQRIAENCAGIENPENAAKVAELNGKQSELLAQKDKLNANLTAINNELGNIVQNIRNLSGSGIEKILQAIKNQRWYFFKNKPKVLMDRDTALLWANLDYFPYCKNNNSDYYSNSNSYAEVKNLLQSTNSAGIDGYTDWKIPTPFELWKMIEDKTFPYQEGNYWYIKNYGAYCVDYNGIYQIKNLYYDGATEKINTSYSAAVIPCSHAAVPTDYENNIAPDNKIYTETEKLQFTLDIFVQNELVPIFDDAEITQLYRQIYVDKPILLKELSELDAQISELQKNEVRLTATFNYKPILAKYDVKAVENSVIQYYEAVLSVTDEFLNLLQEYEDAQAETISALTQIALKLTEKYTDSPHLTDEENNLLKDRQAFLARHLEFGADEVKAQILTFKSQAEELALKLDTITRGKNPVRELAALEVEPRVSFPFLVENLARVVKEMQQKVDFFTLHRDFVTNIVNAWAQWSNDYKAFKTGMLEELRAICQKDGIDEEVYMAWYSDWNKKRFIIEQRFLPLTEFAIKGNLLSSDNSPSPAEKVLSLLHNYKNSVDNFYLKERKNIYQKFAFQAGGELQEKFETESELYKLNEKLQFDVSEIIFDCEKTEERMFIWRWAEPLLNVPVDEIIAFVKERELLKISSEVMEQFAALKRQNFATYLADSKAYGEALQKRESEYNALMFRMRKDLMKDEHN